MISCQQNVKSEKITNQKSKFNPIIFFEQFKKIYGDNGLLETGNIDIKKGGFEIYLISKIGAKNWYDNVNRKGNYDSEISKINLLTPKEINKDFDIWVFYTDKKHLTELEDGSLGYRAPGIIDLYYLKAGTNIWKKIDEYSLKEEKDIIKAYGWKQSKIEDFINVSNSKNNLNINDTSQTLNLSDKWVGKYSAYFSYGEIGGENAGWNLDLEISNDSIKAIGDGYQISFTDLLIAQEENDKLILKHLKNISGYDLGKKMNPEFILIENIILKQNGLIVI